MYINVINELLIHYVNLLFIDIVNITNCVNIMNCINIIINRVTIFD